MVVVNKGGYAFLTDWLEGGLKFAYIKFAYVKRREVNGGHRPAFDNCTRYSHQALPFGNMCGFSRCQGAFSVYAKDKKTYEFSG